MDGAHLSIAIRSLSSELRRSRVASCRLNDAHEELVDGIEPVSAADAEGIGHEEYCEAQLNTNNSRPRGGIHDSDDDGPRLPDSTTALSLSDLAMGSLTSNY